MGVFDKSDYIKEVLTKQDERISKHEEREERTFLKLIDSIDALRTDINELSTKIISISSDNNIKLIELKDDILKVCYEEMALKRELRETAIALDGRIKQLRREAYIVYATLATIVLIGAWLVDHKYLQFG